MGSVRILDRLVPEDLALEILKFSNFDTGEAYRRIFDLFLSKLESPGEYTWSKDEFDAFLEGAQKTYDVPLPHHHLFRLYKRITNFHCPYSSPEKMRT